MKILRRILFIMVFVVTTYDYDTLSFIAATAAALIIEHHDSVVDAQ